MNRIIQLVIIVLLLVIPLSSVNTETNESKAVKTWGKTLLTGKTKWFTQQMSFEEILKIAGNKNKPVFALFTAEWCGPCQKVKKEVFSRDEFQEVGKEVVLYYIEQTEPESKRIIETQKVRKYPTFKLFSKEGKVLASDYPGYPKRTVKGFLDWARDINAGKGPKVRDKTIVIGKNTWYTEETPFDEIKRLAHKEKKRILIVFVRPDLYEKRNLNEKVLLTEEFREAGKKVILWHIVLNSEKGYHYSRQFQARGFPIAKIYSARGKELEYGFVSSNAGKFAKWVANIARGNSLGELMERVESDPWNQPLLMQIARKTLDPLTKLEFLEKAIRSNPDLYEPLTKEAMEAMARVLGQNLRMMTVEEERESYYKTYNSKIMMTYLLFYPDKFQFSLKGRSKYLPIIQWLASYKKYKQALTYYDDYKKSLAREIDLKKDFSIIGESIIPLLACDRGAEALEYLKAAEALDVLPGRGKEMRMEQKQNAYLLTRIFEPFIRYYAETNQPEKAKTYASRALEVYQKSRGDDAFKIFRRRYASKYGIFAQEYLSELRQKIKKVSARKRVSLNMQKASLLIGLGKRAEARKILIDVAASPANFKGREATILNQVAWTMVENGLADQKTIEIAKQSIKYKEYAENLDTLACAYAALGKYKEAIEVEEKALKTNRNQHNTGSLKLRIKIWSHRVQ